MTKQPWEGQQWLEEQEFIEQGFKDDTDLVAMRMYYAGMYIALQRLTRALRIDYAGTEDEDDTRITACGFSKKILREMGATCTKI